MEKLTLVLTTEEVNKILTALSKEAYVTVSDLITKVVTQAQNALEKTAPPTEEDKAIVTN